MPGVAWRKRRAKRAGGGCNVMKTAKARGSPPFFAEIRMQLGRHSWREQASFHSFIHHSFISKWIFVKVQDEQHAADVEPDAAEYKMDMI